MRRRLTRRGEPVAAACARLALALARLALGAAAVNGALACGAPAGIVHIAALDERLDIALADGRVVRLAGLDGSIYRDPKTKVSAEAVLAARFVGKDVELDVLGGGADRWGRIPGDFALQRNAGEPSDSAAEALLAAGFARVRPEFEARSCSPGRLALENEARSRSLGIWADRNHAIIPSSDLTALRRLSGHFAVIEGKVRRVGFGRSRIYLDLAPRGGPTIVVPRKLAPALARAGVSVGGLKGRDVRARGVIDGRFGLRLEVSDPAMIEVALRRDTAAEAEAPQ